MLDSWLPFLIYGTLAVAIPASMIADVVRVRDAAEAPDADAARSPFESGVSLGPPQTNASRSAST